MEKELKFVLPGPEHHARLSSEFRSPPESLQINRYFFGAPGNPLAAGTAMLRLREEAGKYTLTFKGRLEASRGYFTSDEVEEEIPAPVAREMIARGIRPSNRCPAPVAAAASADPSRAFSEGGSSSTFRSRAPIPTGDAIEIDRCAFPGGILDYEAEIETDDPSAASGYVEDLFARIGVPIVPQTRTKYRRFLDALLAHPGSPHGRFPG